MTPRHIVVAMNPRASFGKNEDAGHEVARVLASAGHDVGALREEDYRALETATRDALRPESVLVVVGGDGMVHMGVHLAREKNGPLGLVPAGTGNDLARNLGLPLGSISLATQHLLRALEGAPQDSGGEAPQKRICPNGQRQPSATFAGVPGLEPRTTEPESAVLPITPHPTEAEFPPPGPSIL